MNYIDIIAIVVVALGTLLGIIVGFRKKAFNSILATFALVGSIWIASFIMRPFVEMEWYQTFALETLKNESLAGWILYIACYLVSVIALGLLLKLITLPLAKLLTDKDGLLCHILGGINGFVFSFSLMVVVLLILSSIPDVRDSIEGLKEANSFSFSLSIYDYFLSLFQVK